MRSGPVLGVCAVVSVLVVAFCTSQVQAWKPSSSDAVLLEDIQALTFFKDKWTTSRRSKSIPQLKCVGGEARGQYVPEAVQCRNVGSDGSGDVQWRCEADLPTDYRFGRTDVSCEGYRNSEDPYVLRGSCGLEYTLEFTPQGRARTTESRSSSSSSRANPTTPEYQGRYSAQSARWNEHEGEGFLATLRRRIGQLFVVGIIVMVLSVVFCGALVRRVLRRLFGGGPAPAPGAGSASAARGGWLGGAPRMAPPHYPPPPAPPAGFYPAAPSAPSDDGKTASAGSGPGFWTGAALGGAAGYLASRVTSGSGDRHTATAAPTTTYGRVSGEEPAKQPEATSRTAVGFGETRRR